MDRTFAVKAVFNDAGRSMSSLARHRAEMEYKAVLHIPTHRNVVKCFAQWEEPAPAALLPRLPETVREQATRNLHGRRRREPKKFQFVVFEWLPSTLKEWVKDQLSGTEQNCPPWAKVVDKLLDVCEGLRHIQRSGYVRTLRVCVCLLKLLWVSQLLGGAGAP